MEAFRQPFKYKGRRVEGAIYGATALECSFLELSCSMPRIVKSSIRPLMEAGQSRPGVPVPQFVSPQLSLSVETPPSGSQWVHEIKLDGYRMAARIDNGRAQLLTRTGLDWTGKYPSIAEALANLNAKTAYLDGELCGVDDAGLPSFAQTQAATDGEREVRLIFYAFDLLHLAGLDVSNLPLIERKALLATATSF
jgi:bifunctional non-homologous end joining protein LigD